MGNQISDGYNSSNCRTTAQSSIPTSQIRKVCLDREKIKYKIKEAYYHSWLLTSDEAQLVFDQTLYELIFDDKQHQEYAPISPFLKTIVSLCQDVYIKARQTKLYKSIIDVYNAIKNNRKGIPSGSREKILALRSNGVKWLSKNMAHEQVELKVLHQGKGFIFVTFEFNFPTKRKEKVQKKGNFPSCVSRPKTQKMNLKTGLTKFQIHYHKMPRFTDNNKVMLIKHLIFVRDDFYLGDLLNEVSQLKIEHNVFVSKSRILSKNIWALILDRQKVFDPPKKQLGKSLEKSASKLRRSTSNNSETSLLLYLQSSSSNFSTSQPFSMSQSKSRLSRTSSIKHK